jgi:Tfp pilus assembly protein PilF
MHLSEMKVAPIRGYAVIWLLGFALFGYLAWLAHQHMQKSIATRVLLDQAQKTIPAPVQPNPALTDAFLASASANESSPVNAQDASSGPQPVPKAIAVSALDSNKSTTDKPAAQVEQTARISPPSQTKKTGQRTSAKITRNKQSSLRLAVHPPSALLQTNLLQAYQAYEEGDDAGAQQRYRQVLEGDRANLDAMLGMAAIAQRQGLAEEAAAWYQAVLAEAPNNTLALMATLPMHDKAVAESHIKRLLQGQPKAAYLHAALANLYAEQGLWSAAEAAYFNASQLAPDRAEYAFNLAVSLEHMGQASLAFQQYHRALELLKPTASDSLSKELIETRMQALK